ncbi:hypothetical protein CO033_03105 [Candidatus Nomurabacteria bacterium CG_4_9_14_0_2_um_filter_32_10]|uniref:DUF559 domain-containing protein n=2 Tax=Candidatus Nomuraibacteriota TaxID=1752729 RepID=A0A2H0CI87_9BACT|nr:MAG: hypothetical protein COW91_01430 [Candidatus Nomurabacteria bacterium CG22_combo_CG10-13_8_21_14_all_32_8]PJC49149.1 MAG: hypothetical protein CO033_03105 [Candidatus Nomurabacteria bacterium CG_4_9_14_0_2_um_filter_32_10]
MVKFKTIIKARYLRKEETKAEKILWQKLRNSNIGIKFRRQYPIDMYILDFYAPKIKLSIELDGSVHNLKETKEYDRERTIYLESKYIYELRFWNSEIENNLNSVLSKIRTKIKELNH